MLQIRLAPWQLILAGMATGAGLMLVAAAGDDQTGGVG